MAITPESGNSRQRGLFHDSESGTEAHDDILAWIVSSAGRKTIARTALLPISITCDFSGIVTFERFPEGHELHFAPGCERYVSFPRSGEGFRIRLERSIAWCDAGIDELGEVGHRCRCQQIAVRCNDGFDQF